MPQLDTMLLTILVVLLVLVITLVVFSILQRIRHAGQLQEAEAERNTITEEYRNLQEEKQALELKYNEIVAKAEAEKKAISVDTLTDLPNQRAYAEWVDNVMATIRKEEKIAILHMDIDNFKTVNDDLGHAYGDELLIDVAHRLRQAVGEDDYLARTEGDDFMMVTQNIADIDDYEEKLKKIQTVMSFPFQLAGREYNITLSMGICFAPKDGRETKTLIRNADIAMQQAKKLGKNTYCYYDENLEAESSIEMEKQAKIRTAMEQNQLELWYAPILELSTGTISGYEAKVFWNHPEDGLVNFDEYKQVAEDASLTIPIGTWMMRGACNQWLEWKKQGHEEWTISISLFSRQIKDPEFLQRVKLFLEETGMDPAHLILEIEEDLLWEDLETIATVTAELSSMGIRMALSKFGERYASLNMLKKLPVHILKLSNHLVFSAMENRNSRQMLEGIFMIAEALHLEVTADHVEDGMQEEMLKELHCKHVQGLLYGELLPAGRILV